VVEAHPDPFNHVETGSLIRRKQTKSFFDGGVDRLAAYSRAIGLKRFSSVKTLRMMSGHPLRIFPE
jgi:hypothetical protein